MNNKKFLKKLKNIIPIHIIPKFQYETDLLKWNKKQEKIFSKKIIQNNQNIKIKKNLKKSGIKKLYINCSFKNYHIEHEGHKKVLFLTKNYAKNFNNHISNFIFLGRPGTGKNHLATAIGKYLILKGKRVFITTISNLMLKIKSTFNNQDKKNTEEKFINYLSTIDLLIFDEIGIQTQSKYEKIIINQIVDRRYSSKKSTGMLSNLNFYEIKTILGERIIDRIKFGNSLCLNFNWNSYRNKNQIKL